MRTCAILPAVTAGLWLAAAHGAEAPTPNQVEQLVAQLGSPAYRERVAASRALDALGDVAIDALRRAGHSADAETRRRAVELVERIERRATTARLLAPATFTLDIHQLSRNDAIAEFNKLTGATVRLHSTDAVGTTGRRVSLRTGPVTFWDALEQLCKAASVREWDGLSPQAGLTGVAQIYAARDITRRHKFKYDLLYVRRQSFWLDLRLIGLSFWITFRGTWEARGRKF